MRKPEFQIDSSWVRSYGILRFWRPEKSISSVFSINLNTPICSASAIHGLRKKAHWTIRRQDTSPRSSAKPPAETCCCTTRNSVYLRECRQLQSESKLG